MLIADPFPLSITLNEHESFETVGPLVAINDLKKHDKIFDCDVRIFVGTGEFRQRIKILSADLKLNGSYEGQVCTEVEGKCVLFEGDISFGNIAVAGGKKDVGVKSKPGTKVTDAGAQVQPTIRRGLHHQHRTDGVRQPVVSRHEESRPHTGCVIGSEPGSKFMAWIFSLVVRCGAGRLAYTLCIPDDSDDRKLFYRAGKAKIAGLDIRAFDHPHLYYSRRNVGAANGA